MSIDNTYAASVFDTWFKKNEKLILDIFRLSKCDNCGGDFSQHTCLYCGTENIDLKNSLASLNVELTRLEQIITNNGIEKIPENKFFNLLTLLKDRDIELVNKLLEKDNYLNQYQERLQQVMDKIKNGMNITESYIDVLNVEIEAASSHENINIIYNYFIHDILIGNQKISYEKFKVLIKNFCEGCIKTVFKTAHCKIDEEMLEEEHGNAFFNTVNLKESDVRDLYDRKSIMTLYAISHELSHIGQYYDIHIRKLVNNSIIDQIKEFVISNHDRQYYKDNYSYITYELEAEMVRIFEIPKYLNSLNLRLSNHEMEYLTNEHQDLQARMLVKERLLHGEVTTLDAVFEKVIADHPEALREYTQLNMLYKIENGVVVKKTSEELQNDLNDLLTTEYGQQNAEFYRNFYAQFISGTRT